MEFKNFIFVVVFFISFGFLAYSLKRIISYLLVGKEDDRFDNSNERLLNVIKIAFGQSKLLRDPKAGILHFLIFWGFILFLFAVLEAIIQGFYSNFTWSFLGGFYKFITASKDIFGLLVLSAITFSFIRRFAIKVPRLQGGEKEKKDAIIVLSMISLVAISMFGETSALIAKENFILGENEIRPISFYLAGIFNNESASIWYEIFWWMHILVVFGFMNYLPFSKHFHVYTAIPNVYLADLGHKRFEIKSINLEDENAEQFGVADIEHLSWKQMLDGFTCTECGRCEAVCPAANTGKLLSPKKIIVDIRHRTEEKAPLLISNDTENTANEKKLVGGYISNEEIWACTTCSACVYECPVMNEHVPAIVDMRRNLVLMESEFPSELNPVFKNLETNFSPWAYNPQDRAKWAEGLNIKTLSEDANGEYLFWVGCAGSYDPRYQKVSQTFAKLMQTAGIDFRILGTEEKCNGDTARRLGNEYLAQMLMQENIETLNGYGVKKIVTACPHCFNSIKNEYPQFGGNYEVLHHSELLDKLVTEGKLRFEEKKESEKITFHDSCYLGRYNNIYDEPRTISKIGGVEIVEMERNRDSGFCCGAGGGRMFLEENEGTRINENRAAEAISTGAEIVASACPFCMTMMNDGVKANGKSDEVKVKDIAEIMFENLKIN